MGVGNILNTMSHIIPDRLYLRLKYYQRTHKRLRLKFPRTYNEKLQWLKLYNRDPLYTQMVDKYEVKKYISDTIGEQYVIPTLGVWDRFDDIDFESLPDRFVLKCTHDSGSIVICRDKSEFDKRSAKKKIEASLKCNYYWHGREWPYKNVRPRIMAEKYLEDRETQELRDYKFWTFGGKAKILNIISSRQNKNEATVYDFFDMDFNHLDMRKKGYANAGKKINKPLQFEEMKKLANKLASGIPYVSVDLYEVNGSVFFSEMTFFRASGFSMFEPENWDNILGDWITLPEKNI